MEWRRNILNSWTRIVHSYILRHHYGICVSVRGIQAQLCRSNLEKWVQRVKWRVLSHAPHLLYLVQYLVWCQIQRYQRNLCASIKNFVDSVHPARDIRKFQHKRAELRVALVVVSERRRVYLNLYCIHVHNKLVLHALLDVRRKRSQDIIVCIRQRRLRLVWRHRRVDTCARFKLCLEIPQTNGDKFKYLFRKLYLARVHLNHYLHLSILLTGNL